MNRSLFKNLWVGPDWRKKLLKERSGSYFRYKKFMIFQRSHFNVFLMTLAFYLILLWKLIYMFGFILLSSLQYFISLERLVTWSRAFCSLWVHLVILSESETSWCIFSYSLGANLKTTIKRKYVNCSSSGYMMASKKLLT